MTEDKVEALDQMFPEGYVIVYTCPDGQIRMAMNNPNRYKQLFDYHDLLICSDI